MLSRSVLSTCSRRSLCIPIYSAFTRPLILISDYRSLATVVGDTTTLPPLDSPPKKGPKPLINTAIILNRSPFLTRTVGPFETAYHAYQGRLRRALHNPFPYEFYFKEGSIIETRFVVEERKREREAFGPTFGLDDDLDKAKAAAARAAAAQLAEQEGEHEAMMPRRHPADINNNVESLDRKGMRNLYLLLNTTNNDREVWRFPQGRIQKGELLHQVCFVTVQVTSLTLSVQAAQRSLADECDQYMDSWIVSRNPVGVYHPPIPENEPRSVSILICFLFQFSLVLCSKQRSSTKPTLWRARSDLQRESTASRG